MWRFIGNTIMIGCIGYLLFGYVAGSLDPANGYDMVGLHLRIWHNDRGLIPDVVPLGLMCGYALLFLMSIYSFYITKMSGKKDTIGFTVVSGLIGFGNIGFLLPFLPMYLFLPFEYYNEIQRNGGIDPDDSILLAILFVMLAGLASGLFWLMHVWKKPTNKIALPTLAMLVMYSITAVSVVIAVFSATHLDGMVFRQLEDYPWAGYALLGSSLFLGYFSLHIARRLMGQRVSSTIIGLVMLGMLICGLVWYFAGLGWAILCALLFAVITVIIFKIVVGKIMKMIAWAKSLENAPSSNAP